MQSALRLIIVLFTASIGFGLAQAQSALQLHSEGRSLTLDVNTVTPNIVDGIVLLDADLTSAQESVLIDLRQEQVIAVSSESSSVAADLVLISPTGRIMMIIRNAAPGSKNPIALSGPVAAILQLAAEAADSAGATPGGSVTHDILDNQASETE